MKQKLLKEGLASVGRGASLLGWCEAMWRQGRALPAKGSAGAEPLRSRGGGDEVRKSSDSEGHGTDLAVQ